MNMINWIKTLRFSGTAVKMKISTLVRVPVNFKLKETLLLATKVLTDLRDKILMATKTNIVRVKKGNLTSQHYLGLTRPVTRQAKLIKRTVLTFLKAGILGTL